MEAAAAASDWTASALLTDESDPAEFGHCELDPLNMRAVIDVHNNAEAEETLVHELLHLRLLPFGFDETNEKQAAMNLLADSLVRGYGKAK